MEFNPIAGLDPADNPEDSPQAGAPADSFAGAQAAAPQASGPQPGAAGSAQSGTQPYQQNALLQFLAATAKGMGGSKSQAQNPQSAGGYYQQNQQNNLGQTLGAMANLESASTAAAAGGGGGCLGGAGGCL